MNPVLPLPAVWDQRGAVGRFGVRQVLRSAGLGALPGFGPRRFVELGALG